MKTSLKFFLLVLAVGAITLTALVQVNGQQQPVCGDGIKQGSEQCDDGNHNVTDGCDTFGEIPGGNGECSLTACGDGVLQRPNGDGVTEWCDQPGFCALDPSVGCSSDSECALGSCTQPCTAECGARLMGWAWADTFGWLSLNDDNCDYLGPDGDINTCVHTCAGTGATCDQDSASACGGQPQNCQRQTYFTQISPNGTDGRLTGYAWSDTVGLVCFGDLCAGQAPPTGWQAGVVSEGAPNNIVTGWAGIQAVPDSGGLISLSCRNQSVSCSPDNTQDYGVRTHLRAFQPSGSYAGRCSGSAQLCNPIASASGCAGSCELGYCGDTGNGCNPGTPGVCGAAECRRLGVDRQTLIGYAWHGLSNGTGLGWLEFNPPIQPLRPFLQTEFGDIYALRGLRGDAPTQGFNSTFLILSGGGIQNFFSAQGQAGSLPNFGDLGFPTPETRFSNILGRIDLDRLSCATPGSCTNGFGIPVESFNPATFGGSPLGGRVFASSGNVGLSQAIEIQNAQNFGNGAGTVIVNGDLTITENVTYAESGSATIRFRNLASLAWIVRGDLRIAPNVTQLAGNFIVLGDGASACSSDSGTEGPTNCGQTFTCFDPLSGRQTGTACQNQLQSSGLLMSRKFFFDRTFTGGAPEQGSEVIIYDGRLLANTPPGLEDFVQALPRFTQRRTN